MQAAVNLCDEAGRDFGTVFRRQFALTRTQRGPQDGQGGWSRRSLGGWHLHHCPELRVCDVLDVAGQVAGFFIGIGVTGEGRAITDALRLAATMGEAGFADSAEAQIARIAGRYCVVMLAPGCRRVYFDPVLDLSVVCNRDDRMIASSLLLALDRPLRENNRFNHRMVLHRTHRYGLGHTRDVGVRRMIPNHYLDLDSFALHRHWPKGDENLDATSEEAGDGIDEIVARLGQVFGALVRTHDCAVPVSGGNDSRNLIACGKDHLGHVRAFYSHRINKMSGFDCMVARMLMKKLRQPHQTIDVRAPEHEDRFEPARQRAARWDFAFRTGYQALGSDHPVLVAADLAPRAEVVLRGNVMDILRANQYNSDNLEAPFDLRYGLSRLRMTPDTDAVQLAVWGPEYQNWADTLPENARGRIYDFAFCEQLLPNTMGGTLYGFAQSFYMNPFADRRMLELALRIAPAKRYRGWVNREIVKRASSDLNIFPRTNELRRRSEMHEAVDRRFF
ncbi:hypothetical protein BV394_07595 [Brevirhabdus pacifica]|uniref:Uncharacterized protein n=1 Tax=Brevirhabdus pacifica TaxID=1267768 RepID=A0A1U7DHX0_9RHOB|nr:hypothetical protein [Brevirhabdus pacifica]APX89594.1 hypothetical protein BV394_07595 [Brevirhabdus pacifica]OWU74291.1 hypothetical protein ATO5_14700 [Loktanella sp. 22II-4b]PJJ85738.1 hypothetical protein CLV77_0266 [Brevirhabdus pacifica]